MTASPDCAASDGPRAAKNDIGQRAVIGRQTARAHHVCVPWQRVLVVLDALVASTRAPASEKAARLCLTPDKLILGREIHANW